MNVTLDRTPHDPMNRPGLAAPHGEAADRLSERLDALLRGLGSRKQAAHALLTVQVGDGAYRWAGATGEARPGEALRPDSPFCIASATKAYTATVVLQLHESGALSVDAPIAEYLPRELIQGLHTLDDVDHTDRLTVRHLLAHTSGLADYFEDRPRDGHSFSERLGLEGDRVWTTEDVTAYVRERLSPHFPPQDPDAPRQKVRYSDTNYQLLGAILEAVTGEPVHRVLAERIVEPLGLRQTYLYPHRPASADPEPAALWLGERPWAIPGALASVGAQGGMVSTTDEMIVFLRALFQGELFERSETLDLMRERWNRFAFPRDTVTLRLPSWPIEYALGLMRFQLPRAFTGMRRLPALIGHSGSIGSWMFYAPELDTCICGSINRAGGGPAPFRLLPKVVREVQRHVG